MSDTVSIEERGAATARTLLRLVDTALVIPASATAQIDVYFDAAFELSAALIAYRNARAAYEASYRVHKLFVAMRDAEVKLTQAEAAAKNLLTRLKT